MKVKTIHPFPARMAPDLALEVLEHMPRGSTILDPMMGSGTVVRQALEFGHDAVGYDLDPLAVMMTRAWTTEVEDEAIVELTADVLARVAALDDLVPALPWQQDAETAQFVGYWFYDAQRHDLARLAHVLSELEATTTGIRELAALGVLKVAFSRIIVTKEKAASLARDTSHSRPHRVATESDYRVLPNFERSVTQLRRRLAEHPPKGAARIGRGDARSLELGECSIDAVITSPPYLNAIDYMRGHKMSLVWLGHSIPSLRTVRSSSIGAERAADAHSRQDDVEAVVQAMRGTPPLDSRLEGVIARYALDLLGMTAEIARVLKPGGKATFVVGNSCIRGRYIDNARGVAAAASLAGMGDPTSKVRDLPNARRYLPVSGDTLSKRMRTETILTCQKPAQPLD